MKKLVRRMVTLLSTFILCMAMSMTAFAGYDPNVDPRDDVGNYLLDNYTERDSTVLLYVYAETGDNTVITEQHGIGFKYYEGITDYSMFVRGESPVYSMSFMYRPANAEVYATLDKGEVWVYQFSIENGLYAFGDEFMTEDCLFDDDAAKRRYVENETIHLYTMCSGWSPNNDGSFDTEENITLFEEWAKENEAKLAERTAPQPAEEEPTVVETVEETTVEITTEVATNEETVEEKSVEVEKKEVTPGVDNEPNNTMLFVFIGLGAVLVIAIIVMVILLFKNNNEE